MKRKEKKRMVKVHMKNLFKTDHFVYIRYALGTLHIEV